MSCKRKPQKGIGLQRHLSAAYNAATTPHHCLLSRWPQLCPYPLRGPEFILFRFAAYHHLQLHTI